MSIVLGTTYLMIMPFIDLYTRGIDDINYHNTTLACIMLATVFFEICHIPSGQIIQMSGHFKASKNIQVVAFMVLAVGMALGRVMFGMYGIVTSVLLAAIVLCSLEIGYTGVKIFKRSWIKLVANTAPCLVICLVAGWIGFSGLVVCDSFVVFAVEGAISVVVLSVITMCIYYIIDRESIKVILRMVKGSLKKG